MDECIKIPRHDVVIMQNPMSFDLQIRVMSMEALDNIIEQCRDIKLKMIGVSK